MMKTKLIAFGIVLAVIMIVGVSCAGNTNVPQLTVVSQNLTKTLSGAAILKVTIENTGTTTAQLAEVKVTFYDIAKNVISTSKDSVMNLAPGESWDFQIPCLDPRASQVKSYEIKTTAGSSSGGL